MKTKLFPLIGLLSCVLSVGGAELIVNAFDPNEVHISENPIVKYGENGEVLKINDPEDPRYSTLTSIEVQNSVIALTINKEEKSSEKIVYSVLPNGASTNGFTFTSSDTSVATVSQDGTVQAVNEGVCDVTISNALGTVTAKTHVVVSTIAGRYLNRQVTIKESQQKVDFSKIYVEEQYKGYDTATPLAGGQERTTSYTEFTEKFWISQTADECYFRIVGTDLVSSCEGGSFEQSRNDYIFYTTSNYYTYIFKTDGVKKNYMVVDQNYMKEEGKSLFAALSEVIGNFFTSGAAVINNQIATAKGTECLESKSRNPIVGGIDAIQDTMYLATKSEMLGYELGVSDSEYFGVETGTEADIIMSEEYLMENSICAKDHLTQEISFDKGNERIKTVADISYYTRTSDIEFLRPTPQDGYTLVDDIYSL